MDAAKFQDPLPVTVDSASERLASIPFVRALGLKAVDLDGDGAVTEAAYLDAFDLDGVEGRICDGVVAGAIDQAGSVAIWKALGLQMPHATVSLSVTFVDHAPAQVLRFHGRLASLDHGLGHTIVTARTGDGTLLAHGMVNYAIGVYPGDSGVSKTLAPPDPSRLGDEVIEPLAGPGIDRALGLKSGPEGALTFDYAANLVGSRDPVALHGGAIAAAMVATARRRVADAPSFRLSHFTLDYLRSGLAQQSQVLATVVLRTRKTATVRIDVTQDDGRRHVATGVARFFDSPSS